MIPGFNHTVMHHGTAYHVQTEDSGLQNPVVSTHLFLGGNVLASRRTSYRDLLGSADAESSVRKLMQEQHKEMLRQLVRGAFDREASATAARAFQPGQLGAAAPEVAPPPVARAPAPAARTPPPVLPRVARQHAGPPVLIPEIEDEDLMSDRRLDEIILAYLAEAPGTNRGE